MPVLTIKGHFWWFLISNIFCDPLFRLSTFDFCYTLKHLSFAASFFNKNTVVVWCQISKVKYWLVYVLWLSGKAQSLHSIFWFRLVRADIFRSVWCITPYTFSTNLLLIEFHPLCALESPFFLAHWSLPPCIYSIAQLNLFCNRQFVRNIQFIFVYYIEIWLFVALGIYNAPKICYNEFMVVQMQGYYF